MSSCTSIIGSVLKATASANYWQQLVVASVVPFFVSTAWHFSRTVIQVHDDEQSLWLQMWLSKQENCLDRVRRLTVLGAAARRPADGNPWERRRRKVDDDGDKEEGGRFAPPKFEFQPSEGTSMWTWHGWWPISVTSVASAAGFDTYGRRGGKNGYAVTVWFSPRARMVARDLLLQGRQLWHAKRSKKTEIWLYEPYHSPVCFKIVTRPSRPLSSVIVDGNTKEELRQDAIRFLGAEEWYASKGIPYRRGYLLHGPPGCGKSSLVTALAGDLRLPIVLVPLNDKSMSNGNLMSILGESPKDSIILIEDIDCVLPRGGLNQSARDMMMRMGHEPVTLSGLLNAIDGVGAQEGRLLFMTTNHIDRLDEALIRPGRVDVQFHLGKASRAAAAELFDQFFTSSAGVEFTPQVLKDARSAFLDRVDDGAHSFAALQGVFMRARDDPSLVEAGMIRLLEAPETSDPAKKSSPREKLEALEKIAKKRLEEEEKGEEEQRKSGAVVVKRLVGNPVDVTHNVVERVITTTEFCTFGALDLLAVSGVLFYEIEIIASHGVPQFGFANKDGMGSSDGSSTVGAGDNDKSWALDGIRGIKWHGGEKGPWNCRWKEGTIIGLAANVDTGMIAVSKDGNWDSDEEDLGVSFRNESIKDGVFPCFTASGYKLRYCFREEDFKHGPPSDSVWEESE